MLKVFQLFYLKLKLGLQFVSELYQPSVYQVNEDGSFAVVDQESAEKVTYLVVLKM